MGNRVRTIAVVLVASAGALVVRRTRQRAQAPSTPPPPVDVAHPPRALIRVANPAMRWMLSSPKRMGRAGDELLLLHVTGRRTGRTYDIPVGYRPAADGRLVVVTDAQWRLNLRGGAAVEVTLQGVRRPGRADLLEDADAVAEVYRGLITAGGPMAARRLGLHLAEGHVPTHEELADLVRREHLGVVHLDVDEAYPPTDASPDDATTEGATSPRPTPVHPRA